jgi:hypothetical protein
VLKPQPKLFRVLVLSGKFLGKCRMQPMQGMDSGTEANLSLPRETACSAKDIAGSLSLSSARQEGPDPPRGLPDREAVPPHKCQNLSRLVTRRGSCSPFSSRNHIITSFVFIIIIIIYKTTLCQGKSPAEFNPFHHSSTPLWGCSRSNLTALN